ncbi:MAG: MTH938/NDUFAF3 family protein, partial [Gammaproteobacteria bacterium]|nr:MTH938/NDUFAF3 family protein [Gammaproteobacteria bacterium]
VIFAFFGQQGIGLEVMNTGALCRTFNILVAEDREVVAAIILG